MWQSRVLCPIRNIHPNGKQNNKNPVMRDCRQKGNRLQISKHGSKGLQGILGWSETARSECFRSSHWCPHGRWGHHKYKCSIQYKITTHKELLSWRNAIFKRYAEAEKKENSLLCVFLKDETKEHKIFRFPFTSIMLQIHSVRPISGFTTTMSWQLLSLFILKEQSQELAQVKS